MIKNIMSLVKYLSLKPDPNDKTKFLNQFIVNTQEAKKLKGSNLKKVSHVRSYETFYFIRN